MSWSRFHLNQMSTLQQELQLLVDAAADDSFAGLDDIVQANELLTQAQEKAKAQVEHSEAALQFAESLRPFAATDDHEHVWDGRRIQLNDCCSMATCSVCGMAGMPLEGARENKETAHAGR